MINWLLPSTEPLRQIFQHNTKADGHKNTIPCSQFCHQKGKQVLGLTVETKEQIYSKPCAPLPLPHTIKVPICLSVYVSVCLSVVFVSDCYIYTLGENITICLSVYLSVHLSVCLSICLSVHLSVCLCVCPSFICRCSLTVYRSLQN